MTSSRFFTSEDDPSRYLRVGSDLIRGRGQTPAATLSRSLRFLGGARGEGTVRRAHGDWAERPGWPRHRRPDRKGKPCLGRGLGGTCLAILNSCCSSGTPGGSGEVNPVLFRGTLAGIVMSRFLFVYAALFYYWFLICYWNNDPRADKYFERADRFVMLGLILLVVEPAFILFTINLVDLGLLALGLWFPFIVLLAVGLWSFRPRRVP